MILVAPGCLLDITCFSPPDVSFTQGKLLVAHGKLPVAHSKLPVAHSKLLVVYAKFPEDKFQISLRFW